jgi:hypothetical protein
MSLRGPVSALTTQGLAQSLTLRPLCKTLMSVTALTKNSFNNLVRT